MKYKHLNIVLVLFTLLIVACSSDGESEKVDNLNPYIVCLDDINVEIDAELDETVVTYETPIGIDLSEVTTTLSGGLASGASFPVGTTTNTYLATDASGNTSQCSFNVIVTKKVDPKSQPFLVENILPSGKKWEVVPEFTDEFDGPDIDSKWNLDPQGHSDLNWPGRTPALFQKESFKIIDGEMTIEVGVLPEPVTISPYGSPLTYKYHGGIMRSRVTTTMGNYFECKMKMSKTEMGGGFWLMGRDKCNFKHEIDITESVGVVSPLAPAWAKNWDRIMHSNAIKRKTACNDAIQKEGATILDIRNQEKYYVYGFWWKNATELLFYIDGKYQYTLTPPQDFDHEAFMQFSIESYDWNPIPDDGGKVASASLEDRLTHIDYIRTFKLVD